MINMQDNCVALLTPSNMTEFCSNSTLYDWQWKQGNYTDKTAATEFKRLLANCDAECSSIGNRWHWVYSLSGFANLGLCIQAVLLTSGVFFFPTRCVGMCFQTFCSLFYFSVLIVTTIFRFNTQGQFASISLSGSHFAMVDGVPTITYETTYADDGQRILRLWIVSLIFLVVQCLLGCYAMSPPTQDKLRKWGIDFNEELNEEGKPIVRATF